MGDRHENRVDQVVSDLLRGRRLKLRGGDAEDRDAIIMAARLAAARQASPRMSPAFRQRLARALEAVPREGWLTRRAALVAGLGVVAGAAGGVLIGRSRETAPAPLAAGRSIEPTNGRWFDVGALGDFRPGTARQVTAGAVGAFVLRAGDGVTAVSSICSDLPCELWWDDGHSLLSCPCHHRTFTPDGRSTDQVYPLPPLDVVSVRITAEGRVEVLGA
jgi:nitrite reductase/ring-hydroxylating ferredoxin subunit